MNKNLLLKRGLLMGAVMMMAACGKDESTPAAPTSPDPANPTEVLNALQISKIIFSDDDEIVFTYEGDHLSKVVENGNYIDEWGAAFWEEEMILTYTGEKLTKVVKDYTSTFQGTQGQTQSGQSIETKNFQYNERDQVSQVEFSGVYVSNYVDSYGEETRTETLVNETVISEYDAQNRLVKLSYYDVNKGEYPDRLVTYSWSEKNLAKEQWYFSSENSGGRINPFKDVKKKSSLSRINRASPVMEEEYVYSNFDDKKNPLMVLSILYDYSEFQFISQNNPGKIVDFWRDENGDMFLDDETTFTYTYDAQGRPTTITLADTEEGGYEEYETITIEYRN